MPSRKPTSSKAKRPASSSDNAPKQDGQARHSASNSTLLPTPVLRPGGLDIHITLQKTILQAFQKAFPVLLDPNTVTESLQPLLQQVKHHLFNRDFVAAFSRPDYLEAYAVRWSAARALGYLEIFTSILSYLPDKTLAPQSHDQIVRVISLGGGAGAEFAALVGLRCTISSDSAMEPRNLGVDLTTVDLADWSPVIGPLQQSFRSLSNIKLTTLQQDLLVYTLPDTLTTCLARNHLTTLMFTLNELYSHSLSATQTLILELTLHMPKNSLLLVVDSPGSYSTVRLNGREKQYPMAWLLEHALFKLAPDRLGTETPRGMQNNGSTIDGNVENGGTKEATPLKTRRIEPKPVWERIHSTSSTWFRQPPGLQYPIKLENMRYQLHLYRRL